MCEWKCMKWVYDVWICELKYMNMRVKCMNAWVKMSYSIKCVGVRMKNKLMWDKMYVCERRIFVCERASMNYDCTAPHSLSFDLWPYYQWLIQQG